MDGLGATITSERDDEMASVNVVSLSGAKVGEFELLDEVFGAGINDALLWEAVKHYRAALRQGTAATKTRKNVSGSGKKLWKQKGTGVRASDRFVVRFGDPVERSTAHSRAATSMRFRARS